MPLFSGEALPGEGLRQRQQVLFCQSIHWASVGGAMHTRIDPLAPRMRLAVEISKIGKRDACPHALLHHAYRALDFPFVGWDARDRDKDKQFGQKAFDPFT